MENISVPDWSKLPEEVEKLLWRYVVARLMSARLLLCDDMALGIDIDHGDGEV